MSDNLEDHVEVNVSLAGGGVPRIGFGGMGILSHNAATVFGGERSRDYGDPDEVLDDWDSTSPEYRASNAAFAQDPKPETVTILSTTVPVTQIYTLDTAIITGSKLYSVDISGEGFEDTTASFTTPVTPDQAAIHSSLLTQMNAVASKNYTAAFAALVVADTTFVGEADDDTLTSANALVFADRTFTAAADDIITMAAHTLSTGDGPFRLTTSAADLPLNLLIATDYWVIRIDANTFYFASTLANALAGIQFDIGDAGSGVHTMADTADTRRVVAHTLLTGDGPIQVSNAGGGLPGGLVAVTDYWVIRLTDYTFKLATTLAFALAGTAQALSSDGTGVQTLADTASTKRPSDLITITADAPGNWFSLRPVQNKLFDVAQTHTVSGLADDLGDILDEDQSWYCLILLYPSKDYVVDAAGWIESSDRVMVIDVNESKAINTSQSGGQDTLEALRALQYKRTMYAYHHSPAQFFSAAWMGRWLPTTPGKSNTKWKTLSGITANTLNTAQKGNLTDRRANTYLSVGGVNVTLEGYVGSLENKWFDVTRNKDWFSDRVRRNALNIFVNSENIPYTPSGMQMLGGSIAVTFKEAIDNEVAADDPAPSFTLPDIDDVSDDDKGDRILRNVKAKFTFGGSINKMVADVNISF